jgi:hypothetical protein
LCREFTINLISEWFVEAANHTCGEYDRGVNEIELSGLTPVPSVKVQLHAKLMFAHAGATACQPAACLKKLQACNGGALLDEGSSSTGNERFTCCAGEGAQDRGVCSAV